MSRTDASASIRPVEACERCHVVPGPHQESTATRSMIHAQRYHDIAIQSGAPVGSQIERTGGVRQTPLVSGSPSRIARGRCNLDNLTRARFAACGTA